MLKAAKKLHNMGFAIHLLKPKSKIPIEMKWTTGPRKSWVELTKNFRPGMNIGCRLGTASMLGGKFLAVIDCDVKSKDPNHTFEMESALKKFINKPAPIVWSGRGNGSRHIYIRTEKPISPQRLSQSKDHVEVYMPSVKPSRNDEKALGAARIKAGYRFRPAWEISLMGEGQQVVVPPSIHPDSGKSYVWGKDPLDQINHIPLAALGDGIGDKTKKEKLNDFKAVSVDLLSSTLNDDMVALITEGDGCAGDKSASVFKACLAMSGAGFSDLEILSVLTDEENYLGDVGYRHANTSSRKRAAEWVKNFGLGKARKKTSADRFFKGEVFCQKLSSDDAKEQEQKILGMVDWRSKISRVEKTGIPHPSFKNVKLILQGTLGKKSIGRDDFNIKDFWLVNTPWSKKGGLVSDDDVIQIKDWLAHKFRMEVGIDKINESLMAIALNHRSNPVKEYLESITWDGQPRINSWLKKYLNAEGPEKYLRVIGRKVLVAMIARIYRPGCKFDNVLILEGEQGIGKSTTARILASDKWFSDSGLDMHSKDGVVNMQGVWVYELGELSALNRSETNMIKQFISSSVDKIRMPYGRRTGEFPRQGIFIGTTNNDEYLKDSTGNRRYWPVKCGRVKMNALRNDRDQLLAEAKVLFDKGETLWVKNKKINFVIAREQKLRVEVDEIQDLIGEYLERDECPKYFRMIDVLQAPDLEGVKFDRFNQIRISNALRNLGYKKTKGKRGKITASWWSKK